MHIKNCDMTGLREATLDDIQWREFESVLDDTLQAPSLAGSRYLWSPRTTFWLRANVIALTRPGLWPPSRSHPSAWREAVQLAAKALVLGDSDQAREAGVLPQIHLSQLQLAYWIGRSEVEYDAWLRSESPSADRMAWEEAAAALMECDLDASSIVAGDDLPTILRHAVHRKRRLRHRTMMPESLVDIEKLRAQLRSLAPGDDEVEWIRQECASLALELFEQVFEAMRTDTSKSPASWYRERNGKRVRLNGHKAVDRLTRREERRTRVAPSESLARMLHE